MAAEQKTKPTKVSVEGFLKKVADPQQRKDSFIILKMMKEITGLKPKMWGPTMIGFGDYHYKYASGHEGDCFITGFSPRKGAFSLYIMPGCGRFPDLLKKLGKFKTGVSCLYINKLADVDVSVLRQLIQAGFDSMPGVFEQTIDAIKAKKARKKSRAKRG
jgi:hypothetical protein